MYLPKRFQSDNSQHALNVIREHPLATVISVREGQPFVSHLPLVMERTTPKLVLVGHLARANPHAQLLAAGPVTAIFHGPQAYVTPKWYAENDVPTWNYVVVHARGRVNLVEDKRGLVESLQQLTAQAEHGSQDPWEFWLPPDLATEKDLTSAIVAFRIEVETLEAKFKLSQNRSVADREGVKKGLEARGGDQDRGVCRWMKELE